MLEIFYPKQWIDSVYQIPFPTLYEQGTRGVIFDIDNTLVPHGLEADEQIIRLIKDLKQAGMKVCLLSNNKKDRVSKFAKMVDVPYIYKSGKPAVKNYHRAVGLMGISREQTIFVGDQIFTDIWGANRAGIYSILVSPIHPREELQIVLKRSVEAIVLHFYKKSLPK